MPVPVIDLPNGAQMPRLGMGTWPMRDREVKKAVETALGLGYRLIDTAHEYGNESGVGKGIRASKVPREEIFVTTKLNADWHSVTGARESFEMSAKKLKLDYIDLMLIHWPNPRLGRYPDAFQGLVDLLEEGKLRAVGLSNFKPHHVDAVIERTGVTPDVDQIELHPQVTRTTEREYLHDKGIVVESWSPIGRAGDLLREPAVTELAERHGKTAAQVVLRWHVELGLVPIPKSGNPERLEENLSVFDFELSGQEIESLSALDRGEPSIDSDKYGH